MTLENQLDNLKRTLNVDFVAASVYDPIHQELRWRVAVGSLNDRYKNIVIRNDRGICATSLRSKRAFIIADFPADVEDEVLDYPIFMIEELKSIIVVPVFANGQMRGILLAAARDRRVFAKEDVKVAQLCGQEALANSPCCSDQAVAHTNGEQSALIDFLVAEKSARKSGFDVILLDQRMTKMHAEKQKALVVLLQNILQLFDCALHTGIKVVAERKADFYHVTLQIEQHFELSACEFSLCAEIARSMNGRIEMESGLMNTQMIIIFD